MSRSRTINLDRMDYPRLTRCACIEASRHSRLTGEESAVLFNVSIDFRCRIPPAPTRNAALWHFFLKNTHQGLEA